MEPMPTVRSPGDPGYDEIFALNASWGPARYVPYEDPGLDWGVFWESVYDNWLEASEGFGEIVTGGMLPDDWADDSQFDPDDPALIYPRIAGKQFAIVATTWAAARPHGGLLFGKGGPQQKAGLLNRNNWVRIGWGWKGTRNTGHLVFRIATGKRGTPGHRHWDIWPLW
jgi:hypothetical protein